MIRVHLQPEPARFDELVRQPGLSAIDELVGEEPRLTRPGPKRKQLEDKQGNPITDRGELPSSKFPDYWTRALDDLLDAYGRVCAFTAFYIEPVTGAPSVDHMIPRSTAWDEVYEWANYRLACALVNSRKGACQEVLDPFEVEDGWFQMEFVGFQLKPNPELDAERRGVIRDTITQLGLNEPDCTELRQSYYTNYIEGHISWAYLSRRAPLVAMEIERRGERRDR